MRTFSRKSSFIPPSRRGPSLSSPPSPLPGPLDIIGLHHPWIDPFPPILEKLRGDPSSPPELIRAWEERHEHLLEVRGHRKSGGSDSGKVFHSALIDESTDAPPVTEEEPAAGEKREKRPAAELMRDLSAGQKVALALKGNSEVRRALITDKNRSVCTKVLENPGITESEVVFFSRLTTLSRDVLRIIGTNREWMKNRTVTRSLAANPKTPLGISMKHLPRLSLRDIKALTTNRNIPAALRHAAEDVLRARIENR